MGAETRRDVMDPVRVADWPGDPTAAEIEATQAWRRLGLTDEEFARFRETLGRPPSWTELGMLSVAWSEHCAYKHSREALKRLPATGSRLVMGPGESAGVLAIGEGWAVAVRLESHNHPSYVEPYQGAATGVGGIVRDVLAAGARPVALLDSLRFGLPETPANRYLFREVVAGIAGYGNAIGVPTVGGEVAFAPCYDTNPLVNVMCVGWVRADRVVRARADGPGNRVYLVGARTGRDGIHGAGLLASRTFRDGEGGEQRPRVQVGDPFTEKLLIEACLEALETGAVVGIQDLGAAGITAAASELAARAGTGIDLDLDRVPCREAGMTPYEMMLSESQERMMLVVRAGREAEVERIFARWRLEAAPIGVVTANGRLRVRAGGRWVADVPAALLADGRPPPGACAAPTDRDVPDGRVGGEGPRPGSPRDFPAGPFGSRLVEGPGDGAAIGAPGVAARRQPGLDLSAVRPHGRGADDTAAGARRRGAARAAGGGRAGVAPPAGGRRPAGDPAPARRPLGQRGRVAGLHRGRRLGGGGRGRAGGSPQGRGGGGRPHRDHQRAQPGRPPTGRGAAGPGRRGGRHGRRLLGTGHPGHRRQRLPLQRDRGRRGRARPGRAGLRRPGHLADRHRRHGRRAGGGEAGAVGLPAGQRGGAAPRVASAVDR
ncbi:phosphoribosylformylglycinamidine synthase subunit PurL [Geochorda subterranea]|uniref:Phosphoribosylformylglycinamidine synthase subunit PurL n=1 Tax=Geochorda subterranea TaxID=3109564 RepID=A0ABZ1BQR6_9FIRM|nr:phosphoribosylformylglycinamidine synthase subunit PurL [Limnochorda sp. LNt]WRP14913.1 phosphoribosylformylglycinamidine synthase subunit PurL [Limnochorda sp. LNt]